MFSTSNLERTKELASLLKAEMTPSGYWEGQLSSSALGVAVAITAFHFYNCEGLQAEIDRGVAWLVGNQNTDGGFGDTTQSQSNISTSMLCLAALHVNRNSATYSQSTFEALVSYLRQNQINPTSKDLARNVLDIYKTDYTFSVPILAMCAYCGIPSNDGFRPIPQLPFELALLPRSFYRFLNLNVVSYAIPALVAVGISVFMQKKQGRLIRWIRQKAIGPSLRKLEMLMPESGGFLEAIPLTAFVSLSLIKAGYLENKVVKNGIDFLKRTQRTDGSWPIDVDLSTWVTTLSVKALGRNLDSTFSSDEKEKLKCQLLSIQNKTVHPFNGTTPGGWGWTTFSGSVPDCDDTPGAILTLLMLSEPTDKAVNSAIEAGCDWLLKLQNRDGGFPTFSRGWGKLPFDQSSCDLTGHVLLALSKSKERLKGFVSEKKLKRYARAINRSFNFLLKQQSADGAWVPLWFGNQNHPKHHNPVYGTARVCAYLAEAIDSPALLPIKIQLEAAIRKAQNYLASVQNEDGSWGGDKNIEGTIEETSLAITALAKSVYRKEREAGLVWLNTFYNENGLKASPIGLYFASLWYDEKLYPLTMYLEALSKTQLE